MFFGSVLKKEFGAIFVGRRAGEISNFVLLYFFAISNFVSV
jgi:hypothetical protein